MSLGAGHLVISTLLQARPQRQYFQLLTSGSGWTRACSIETRIQAQTMKPTTKRDMDVSRLQEDVEPIERDHVSRGDVVTDSSAGWDGAVRLLRDWRRQYRGSVLCQK